MKIPSIEQITEKVILDAAWKKRELFRNENHAMSGPKTRARANGKVNHPIQKGYFGRMISTALVGGWNRLPSVIKDEDNAKRAKNMIKNLVLSPNV